MSIAYVPQKTSKKFHVPKTLAADFDAFLNHDIPNTNMDFELLHDWYDKLESSYEPSYIRGELYPDSTKSRYENTDNNMNIRCSLTSGIRKGDMVIEPDGTTYILDWDGHKESNNIPSRALRCNMILTIKRYEHPEVVQEPEQEYITDEDGTLLDEDGFVVQKETQEPVHENEQEDEPVFRTVVDSLPANAYRYDGRPEFVAVSATPGAIANALTLMTVQYNVKSKDIRIGDIFDWGNETYEIVDVNRVGLHISGEYGTLNLKAKKKAGGLHGY